MSTICWQHVSNTITNIRKCTFLNPVSEGHTDTPPTEQHSLIVGITYPILIYISNFPTKKNALISDTRLYVFVYFLICRGPIRRTTILQGPNLPGPYSPGPKLPGPNLPDPNVPGAQSDRAQFARAQFAAKKCPGPNLPRPKLPRTGVSNIGDPYLKILVLENIGFVIDIDKDILRNIDIDMDILEKKFAKYWYQ